MPQLPSVLFVCLGNICRSPLAEAALRARAQEAGLNLEIDSAGTGDWHIGHPPDERAQAVAREHGSEISGYRAWQVNAADFRRFTHIFALDHSNLANLRALAPSGATAELKLLLDVVPGQAGQAVADPYYGSALDFETTWAEVDAAAQAFVALLMQKLR